jgi:hypothetical protein
MPASLRLASVPEDGLRRTVNRSCVFTALRVKYRTDMKVPFIHNTLVTFIAIGLIVVSTAALSVVSYRYTVGRENLAETSLVQSNIKLATNYVEGIERSIVDNDLVLLQMIDVDEPSKWPAMIEAIKQADLNVDQVYFLRPESNTPLYPPYSYAIRNQWGAFINSFKVKELGLADKVLDQPHHLHMERPNNYFFATYVLKETRKGSRIRSAFK